MNIKDYCYDGDRKFSPKNFNTADTAEYKKKRDGSVRLMENLRKMASLQDKLYAENKESVLIIFQAMDAAGKDSAIKNVMSGMNPHGVSVHDFKSPSSEELEHDYLWRANRALPERGNIGIFNRSYYEDVLVVKVRQLHRFNLPSRCVDDDIFKRRYRQINDYERYLYENGVRIIKLFLNISKDEQKARFLARIENQEKNWKFSDSDIKERTLWDQYQTAYKEAINATSTSYAPWYVIPADKKWFSRVLISEIIVNVLEDIKPQYPVLSKEATALLSEHRQQLLNE